MKTIQIVEDFNAFLSNTKFKISICGRFGIPFERLKKNDEKYVLITNREDDDECYMDWYYDKFSKKELKIYGKEIPTDQGIGTDETSREYLELSKLIDEYVNKVPKLYIL